MFLARYKSAIRAVLIAYWAVLFIGTHAPRIPAGVAEISDKLLHYAAYAGLGFLLAADREARGAFSLRRCRALWLLIAAYAALDELLQMPVGRTADFWDWVADVIGAACGLGIYALLFRMIRRITTRGR